MGYHIGKNGAVKIGANTVAAVQSWSLDIQTETVKGWGMGDAWTTSETLMQSWSGNVECYLDPEDAGQNALAARARSSRSSSIRTRPPTATPTTPATRSFPAGRSRPRKAISSPITFNFEGQGALTTETVDAP